MVFADVDPASGLMTPESLAEGLRVVAGPRAPELGRNGAQLVREAFRWEDVARSWLEQARGLLAKSARPL